MKRNFMWYYSITWISWYVITYGYGLIVLERPLSFWGLLIITPTVIWLLKTKKIK